jgi:hypothetical protein
LRKVAFLFTLAALLLLPNFVSAQQADASLGFSALMSPGAAPCNVDFNTGFLTCPEKGGVYPNIAGDVIFHKRLGFGFDVAWRGGQGNYGGLGIPYRPILLAFNGVYQPRLGKKAGLDLSGGIGMQSTRFYSANYTCSFVSCTNFTSSHHFLVDMGAGIRYYVWGHVFVRPEVRYYWVNNNSVDFTSSNLFRVGASIGYTIGPE